MRRSGAKKEESNGDADSEYADEEKRSIPFSDLAPESIVDLRTSSTRLVDEELVRRGYSQLLPDIKTAGYSIAADSGSFGRGQNLWVWRNRQSSMEGRLKTIVDIQLNALSVSSAMVLAGYTCLSAQVSGQWVWIKRAQTEEEEKDALLDLVVTIGLQKNPNDKIWTSPGVGWNRVDGNFGKGLLSSFDAFLWFRPARARTSDALSFSPMRSTVALKEYMRFSVLLGQVKRCLRHAVPMERMVAIASSSDTQVGSGRPVDRSKDEGSQPSFDFSLFFHKFDKSSSGKLTWSRLEALLVDVGLRLERRDINALFHAFDSAQIGSVSRLEFWTLLALTDMELESEYKRLHERLLFMAGGGVTAKTSKATRLRLNSGLREIFRGANRRGDGVLSLSDLLSMCFRCGIYLTEDEGRRLMRAIDRDHDDRVEEADFVSSLGRPASLTVNKAHRLRDAAAAMRVWLNRNTNTGMDPTAAVTTQWQELRAAHEKSYGTTFDGFLTADDLLCILRGLGVALTPAEARELALIIGPERNGRLQQPDLVQFMRSSCRSFGELCALLGRDLMKPLFDCYRGYRGALLVGEDALELKDELDEMVKVMTKAVTTARTDGSGTSDVVSVPPVKSGIETVMRGYSTPDEHLPNLEEWVCLCTLAGAAVAEGDTFGVRLDLLVEGLCSYIVGPLGANQKSEECSLAQVSSELVQMIRHEAELAGRGRQRDYKAVFAMFDEDGSGAIEIKEFRDMLRRLQIIENLTESQVPALLKMFDRKGAGKVTLDDFSHFAETGVGGGPTTGDDSDEEDRRIGLLSNNPPATITNDAACDWLIWFLWKECCKLSPKEPEAAVTDIEVTCSESSLGDTTGFIDTDELWRILSDLSLRGHMTRAQFNAGAAHLSERAQKGAETTLVDYEALCRCVVRMGRAFNEQEQKHKQVDESRYQELKKEFIAAMKAEDKPKEGQSSPRDARRGNSMRFERVFKRMDSNSDGCITLEEFKAGLKQMRYGGAKHWSQQMVWRLFEDIDKNADGVLNLMELSSFVRSDGQSSGHDKFSSAKKKELISDDDDEDVFVRSRPEISDEKLFYKVSQLLQEAVPPSEKHTKGEHAHVEAVKASVRKFFKRSDEAGRGLVPEARFKVFSRQSGLSAKLSAAEMKTLMLRLRRNTTNSGETMIDYERLCSRITVIEDSVPHAKGEAVMLRLQDAAVESESNGRSFLGLCSLSDRDLTGRLSEQDLVHTSRMMGCDLSAGDVLAIKDLFPHTFTMNGSATVFDYHEIARLLEAYTPRDVPNHGAFTRTYFGSTGGLQGRASQAFTPSSSLRADRSFRADASLRSPGGFFLSTPLAARTTGSGYDLVLRAVAEKVSRATMERSRVQGFSFSLQKQFAAFDRNDNGTVSITSFQSLMEDLGVSLSSTDLLAISSSFGTNQRGTQEMIDYRAFSKLCASVVGEDSPATLRASRNDSSAPLPFLRGARITRRLAELRRENSDPRELFEAIDVDRTGLVSVRRFEDVVRELDLLQSENQLASCISAFSSLSERNMICYEDFCDAIENSGDASSSLRDGFTVPRHTASRSGDLGFGSDDYSTRASRSNLASSFRSERKPPRRETIDSYGRFEEEDGDDARAPPLKRGDSTARAPRYPSASPMWRGSDDSVLLRDSLVSSSPLRVSKSIEAPRSPPGRVGAAMWGSGTPLGKKGLPPRGGDEGKWCCAVCYYTENGRDSSVCEVCTSPNHNADKGFQVKVQCANCTFMNGQFALACEMCGRNLGTK